MPSISGKLVIFLQEDHHAVGEFNALRLLRMESGQRWDGDLLPARRLRGSARERQEQQWPRSRISEIAIRFQFIAHLPDRKNPGQARRDPVLDRLFRRPFAFRSRPRCGWCRLKVLVGDAANVGLGHLIDAVHRAEQFAPVAVASLVNGELGSQSVSSRPGRGSGWPWCGS